MNNKHIIFFAFLFLLISCDKDKYEYSFMKSDSIAIPIDESISQITGCLEYIDYENKPTLLFSNRDIQKNVAEILFFDLNKKTIYKIFIFL